MLIESEDPGGSEILCVHLDMQTVSLEMTQMLLGSQVDTPKGPTDTPDVVNTNGKMAVAGHSDGVGTYLGAGSARCGVNEMNGVGSHVNASSMHADMQSVAENVKCENDTKNIKKCPNSSKMHDSPLSSRLSRFTWQFHRDRSALEMLTCVPGNIPVKVLEGGPSVSQIFVFG